tara:strand:- start:19 stop:147 length:129 start_codon:yes stop_codon:yes gene_type:complete
MILNLYMAKLKRKGKARYARDVVKKWKTYKYVINDAITVVMN